MEDLTDLESIRKRPAMFIGGMDVRGLHHLFDELVDNSIDQFLAGQATFIRAGVRESLLEFSDDGPGLPFDVPHDSGRSLASVYLTKIRRNIPTADGHTPHVHLGGWGCGLRIVTALTESCEVTSCRSGNVWRQSFFKGVETESARIVRQSHDRGTTYRMSVDRDVFDNVWSEERINERLTSAAYLFPGLCVKSPAMDFTAGRGLADLAVRRATQIHASHSDRVCWVNGWFGDIHIQAALVGQTDGETRWAAFANGSTSIEKGSHLTALKRAVSACKLKPAVAMIHVIMRNPRFAGPTRTKLDAPEIVSQVYQALTPDFRQFSESR